MLLAVAAILTIPTACTTPRPQHSRATNPPRGAPDTLSGLGSLIQLTTPPAWVMDRAAGRSRNMLAVFYPQQATFDTAEAFLFVRALPASADLQAEILRDKNKFARGSALVVMGEAELVRASSGQRISLRTFSGRPDGMHQAVAYVPVRHGHLRLVLRATDRDRFEAALPALESLLGSLRID